MHIEIALIIGALFASILYFQITKKSSQDLEKERIFLSGESKKIISILDNILNSIDKLYKVDENIVKESTHPLNLSNPETYVDSKKEQEEINIIQKKVAERTKLSE